VGFIVSAALLSLACVYAFVATQSDASIARRTITSGDCRHVSAGLVVALGFFVLTCRQLTGFRP
jgi:hypothetical protein